jgi:hypothetical protein
LYKVNASEVYSAGSSFIVDVHEKVKAKKNAEAKAEAGKKVDFFI